MICPLCQSNQSQTFYEDQPRVRSYWLCAECEFVFADPTQHLDAATERSRYAHHQNGPEQPGYVRFLTPVVEILSPHLRPGDLGLDYGSGPGPIMPLLLKPLGVEVELYDPHFHPRDLTGLSARHFITCTEAFEHFYQPAQDLDRITSLLRPEGYLLLMTEFRRDLEHFKTWSYRNDDTHVGFLSGKTLQWVAEAWGYSILSSDGRLSLLKKN